jgi:S-formylglutathione hydrolase FrmB
MHSALNIANGIPHFSSVSSFSSLSSSSSSIAPIVWDNCANDGDYSTMIYLRTGGVQMMQMGSSSNNHLTTPSHPFSLLAGLSLQECATHCTQNREQVHLKQIG